MRDGKIHRITFSESLAEHILTLLDPGYEIITVEIVMGKRLKPGQESKSGLYGIVANGNDRLLRVSLNREIAEFLCDYDSRYIAECFIAKEEKDGT